jgi:RecA/RadA recombinase
LEVIQLSRYDELLEQAKERADAFRSTAKEFISKMYTALHDENPNTSPEDARDRISSIAQTYRIAVVVTNQVNYSSHPDTAKPTGGNIIAHSSTYRISLRRLHPDHNDNISVRIVAKIVASLYHPENQAHFMLSEKGIEDIQKS